jgi:hypothetical protein
VLCDGLYTNFTPKLNWEGNITKIGPKRPNILPQRYCPINIAHLCRSCTTWGRLPCSLPYRLQGVLHTECTERRPDDAPDGRAVPMCPTRLGRDGEGEDWGRCGVDCGLASYSSNKQVTGLSAR